MTIIPMRDLKNTVEIEKRCAEANGPVFVTKNGYGKLVVMDIEYYEKTLSKIYEAKLINEGLSDLENGKIFEGTSVKAGLSKKYGV
ncbi:MAG: type II toxin-antitoxin system Phd/YefM family antitoxin [Clostridia bacterium]|nr:type II toxin-antitoxin system Phd/YefM family antitoxin [Clostridia bacterium]